MELNSSTKHVVLADASFIPVSATGNMVTNNVKTQLTELDSRVGMGSGMKNKLINGNFDIWQRGVTQSVNGYGSDDRWSNVGVGSTFINSQQIFPLGQTNVPNNPKYFNRTVITSVAGVGNWAYKYQYIENVSTLAGKTATLSFWAKADSNKNIAVDFQQNFGTGGSPSTAIMSIGATKFSLTSSWQKFSVTITVPSISGMTLGTNINDFLQVCFWFDAGSSYATRSSNIGQQSGTFDISQVQLEEGSVATNFEQRHIQQELTLCQRYFHVIKGMASGYNPGGGNNTVYSSVSFPVEMRAIPTMTGTTGYVVTLDVRGACYYTNTAVGNWYSLSGSKADAEL